jgi:hypothetical protein
MERVAYCVMIDTVAEGIVPSILNENGKAWTFPTRREAELEIADLLTTRLQEFRDGDRDFDDAITIEEFVVEVHLLHNGEAIDEVGNRFEYFLAPG